MSLISGDEQIANERRANLINVYTGFRRKLTYCLRKKLSNYVNSKNLTYAFDSHRKKRLT